MACVGKRRREILAGFHAFQYLAAVFRRAPLRRQSGRDDDAGIAVLRENGCEFRPAWPRSKLSTLKNESRPGAASSMGASVVTRAMASFSGTSRVPLSSTSERPSCIRFRHPAARRRARIHRAVERAGEIVGEEPQAVERRHFSTFSRPSRLRAALRAITASVAKLMKSTP